MGSHSWLKVNGHIVTGWREGYPFELASMFQDDELATAHDDEEDYVYERYAYRCSVAAMRERLVALGFTTDRALDELKTAIGQLHARSGPVLEGLPMTGAEDLLGDLRLAMTADDPWSVFHEPEVFLYLDERVMMRLAIDQVPADAEVALDLTEVVNGDYVDGEASTPTRVRAALRSTELSGAPLIVLTEGSTDAALLADAMSVICPHLKDFVRFMDFASSNAEGGAHALVRTVRVLIAAGVSNRVVALVDNDTAGHEALRQLSASELPGNIRVRHLPRLALLARYPTIGPPLQKVVAADVNGTAASIELYLGRDVLTDEDGLTPVQWFGYVESQGRYQGSVLRKEAIQRRFRAKVKAAKKDPDLVAGQDWTGLRTVFDTILTAFDTH